MVLKQAPFIGDHGFECRARKDESQVECLKIAVDQKQL